MNHCTWGFFFRHGKNRRDKPSRRGRTRMQRLFLPACFLLCIFSINSFFFFFKVVLSINRKPSERLRGGDQPPPAEGCGSRSCNNTSHFPLVIGMRRPLPHPSSVSKQFPTQGKVPLHRLFCPSHQPAAFSTPALEALWDAAGAVPSSRHGHRGPGILREQGEPWGVGGSCQG